MICKILACILFQIFLVHCSTDVLVTRTCEPITIEQCKNIGYNVTGMPNFVGHDMQRDAEFQIKTFSPLLKYGCSSRLGFFLCSVYAPMCTEKVPQPIGPCRPLCEAVQGLCEPVLQEFGFPWPSALNCSQFPPENNLKHMCMDGPEHEEKKTNPFRERSRPRTITHRVRVLGPGVGFVTHNGHFDVPNSREISRQQCKHLRQHEHYIYVNKTGRCAPACDADILYSKENKDFAAVWLAFWSFFCFLSCLFTIIGFFTNSAQFRYPEKAIAMLGWCSFLFSVSFSIPLIGGRNDTSCYSDSHYKEPLLVQRGLDNINCNIGFTLLYFFHMASNLWWVILSLTWFLTAGLRWTIEKVESYGTYYHLIAWSLPALKTIAILVLRGVDADELTGMCYVGNQDPELLLQFVLVPSIVYWILGIIFLFAGLITVYKNNVLRSKLSLTDERHELLMVRTGIFTVLYAVPATCIIAATVYEYSCREQWLANDSELRPNVEIFILKIFMSLIVGFTTSVWLWSSRAPHLIRSNLSTFCVRRKDLPTCGSENRIMLLNEHQNQKMTIV
ncbi:frizzled-4-like [Uloborus diversus]|uniref:frizzled-4-like n=1 Tax=Uloborus diversus TaxID=327109 RepID=UPI00240A54A6|nr:frizzled-4-like [Uloborus diversus]